MITECHEHEVEMSDQENAKPAAADPARDLRKKTVKGIVSVAREIEPQMDPANIGQADFHYLLFRAANSPNFEFINRMEYIAAVCLLAVEFHNKGFLRYEGHLAFDPELEILKEQFPNLSAEQVDARREELVAALKRKAAAFDAQQAAGLGPADGPGDQAPAEKPTRLKVVDREGNRWVSAINVGV